MEIYWNRGGVDCVCRHLATDKQLIENVGSVRATVIFGGGAMREIANKMIIYQSKEVVKLKIEINPIDWKRQQLGLK